MGGVEKLRLSSSFHLLSYLFLVIGLNINSIVITYMHLQRTCIFKHSMLALASWQKLVCLLCTADLIYWKQNHNLKCANTPSRYGRPPFTKVTQVPILQSELSKLSKNKSNFRLSARILARVSASGCIKLNFFSVFQHATTFGVHSPSGFICG